MRFLSLCLIAKDEGRYLPEWLDYHALAGVDHFYVYDNADKPVLDKALAGHVRAGLATVVHLPGPQMQMAAYGHCLENFGDQSLWIGFLDADEFALAPGGEDLRVLLSDYFEHAGLAASWVIFGSGGHEEPRPSQIFAYDRRFPMEHRHNLHVKCLVRPGQATGPVSPHRFAFKPGAVCVNEHRLPVMGDFSYHTAERIRVNHYYFRSRADFTAKMRRGRADVDRVDESHSPEAFARQLDQAVVRDTALMERATALKAARFQGRPDELARASALPGAGEDLGAFKKKLTALLGQGRADQAELALCAGEIAFAHNQDYWSLRGMCHRLIGRRDAARRDLGRSLALCPSMEAYLELARLEMAENKAGRAKHLLDFLENMPELFGLNPAPWLQAIKAERAKLQTPAG